MEISVIIPTYRETDRLNRTLGQILPYLEKRFHSFEIIVADDPDSNSKYTELLPPFSGDRRIQTLLQPQRLGKGAALRRGCLAGSGDIIFFMDADHATPIEELDRFLSVLKNHSECMVCGARVSQEEGSKGRRIVSLLSLLFLHVFLFGRSVADSQCGFKAFHRTLVQKLFPLLKTNGGMIDAEIFFLVHKFGLPTVFLPVPWENDPDSRINILSCMIWDPVEIFKIRWRNLRGVYNRPLKGLTEDSADRSLLKVRP